MTQRTLFAESCDRTIDQLRVCSAQSRVIEAHGGRYTRPEIFNDYIGLARQPRRRLAAAGALEIDHDALLVPIEAKEHRALIADKRRTHPPCEIARRWLDLDHLR